MAILSLFISVYTYTVYHNKSLLLFYYYLVNFVFFYRSSGLDVLYFPLTHQNWSPCEIPHSQNITLGISESCCWEDINVYYFLCYYHLVINFVFFIFISIFIMLSINSLLTIVEANDERSWYFIARWNPAVVLKQKKPWTSCSTTCPSAHNEK